MAPQFFSWLDHRRSAAFFLLRLFAGTRLIYGVADNLLSAAHMRLFRDFLAQAGFPAPLFMAILSVCAQAFAGLAYITGWKIRYAALLMLINFAVALLTIHLGDPVEAQTPALALFFISLLFLFTGSRIDRRQNHAPRHD
ncbi:DoxX family protein [Pedobacter yulinensis]|uniref:DoxX family protein n=1 Tax=Pedobacter yulinensis TaxID=2126353 RepID=A0A2T3HJH7_9SPHI|nr:DoxX family protein [Pedobacter yulinensis]PST82590.1 DoxX family protein [Pedobacter yulinensis]